MSADRTLPLEARPDLCTLCLATIENSPLPMAAVDGLTHIVRYGNPAFCHLLNKRLEDLIGKEFQELLPAKDVCVALLDRVLETGQPEAHVDEEISDAHPIFWSYTMWPVQADEPLVGILIQVTETAKLHGQTLAMNEALTVGAVHQHELREAAEQANAQLLKEIAGRTEAQQELLRTQELLADHAAQLEAAVSQRTAELTVTNKQLEAFVYSIAHDLRAPLRAMQGFSTLLIEDPETVLSEDGKDYAHRIVTSAAHMDRLIRDLLAFSRIAQQNTPLIPTSLQHLIDTVVERLQPNIDEKHADVEIVGPWPDVIAHEPTLTQVVFNLMSNALKFGRPDTRPKVRVVAEDSGEFFRVWVEDNGIGIAPEHQHQIFKLFTRIHGERYTGTGIGLAIVEKGIERMGGHVGVESNAGGGSRFWFELRKA